MPMIVAGDSAGKTSPNGGLLMHQSFIFPLGFIAKADDAGGALARVVVSSLNPNRGATDVGRD